MADLIPLILDMVLFGCAYLLGIATGFIVFKKKMEKKAEDLMNGLG